MEIKDNLVDICLRAGARKAYIIPTEKYLLMKA